MPALDKCHAQIVHALEKAGYEVAPKAFRLDTAINELFIDILATRTVETRTQEIVVVEAKCFSDPRAQMVDLYTALGQYFDLPGIVGTSEQK